MESQPVTQTEQSEALWAAMCDKPEDWVLCTILADFLEEEGELDEAAALRWKAASKKRVWGEDGHPHRAFIDYGQRFAWFDEAGTEKSWNDFESNLPPEIFAQLGGRTVTGFQREYDSRKEAEEDFVRAFVRAIEKGWHPEGN